MYKISEFALKVGLSVKTLRYYDEFGILKPSEKDKYTGYRYYTDEDVLKGEYIKLLKSLDYTLNEISQNKSRLDINGINQKQQEISDKIQNLKMKYKKLNELKEKMNGEALTFMNFNKEGEENEK